jgi:hypothetical protein
MTMRNLLLLASFVIVTAASLPARAVVDVEVMSCSTAAVFSLVR